MNRIAFFMVLLISCSAFAQNPKDASPAEKADRLMAKWTKDLNLTVEQQTKLRPALENMFVKIARVKADTALLKKDRAMAVQTAKKQCADAFRSVLTPEQTIVFEQRLEQMKAKRQNAANPNKGKGQGQGNKTRKDAEEVIDNDDLF